MLPAQRNKVDISKLTPAEQQAFRMYGKLPNRNVQNKTQERKYFDSGDWVLAKEGKAKGVGTAHPKAEEIPHASPSPAPIGAGTSPGSGGTPIGTPGSGFPSSSPPTNAAFSPPSSGASASAGGAGGMSIPIPGAGGAASGVDLSMSPGRVGVGQPLASSPTRSMHSSFSARDNHHHHHHSLSNTSPTGTGQSARSSLAARMESEAALSPHPLDANTPTGSTGNVVGRAQQHPLPGQEPSYLTSPAVSQPTSNLANPVRTEAEEVEGMDLQ